MTTESRRDQDDDRCTERSDPVGPCVRLPARPVNLAEWVAVMGKAAPARTGITSAAAELLGEYNLHNG